MNHITQAVASTASLGWVAGVMTAVFLLFFIGWTAWAWWPSNRARMDAAARLPFDDTDSSARALRGEA